MGRLTHYQVGLLKGAEALLEHWKEQRVIRGSYNSVALALHDLASRSHEQECQRRAENLRDSIRELVTRTELPIEQIPFRNGIEIHLSPSPFDINTGAHYQGLIEQGMHKDHVIYLGGRTGEAIGFVENSQVVETGALYIVEVVRSSRGNNFYTVKALPTTRIPVLLATKRLRNTTRGKEQERTQPTAQPSEIRAYCEDKKTRTMLYEQYGRDGGMTIIEA